eukprot:COSAG02_NODE_45_length_45811_cov_83.565891_19_plen_84_part_00
MRAAWARIHGRAVILIAQSAVDSGFWSIYSSTELTDKCSRLGFFAGIPFVIGLGPTSYMVMHYIRNWAGSAPAREQLRLWIES